MNIREPVGSSRSSGSRPEPLSRLWPLLPNVLTWAAINLSAGKKGFLCPCHTSTFDLEGKPTNQIPPRPMDQLKVELTQSDDPEVRVKFERFRTQSEEQQPLV